MIITKQKCKIHNQECVAINKDPKCDSNERGLCLECFVKSINNKNQIALINQAEKQFTDIKQEYQYKIAGQANANMEILKDLNDNIVSLKTHYNQILDKLSVNIKEQIQLISNELQQIEQNLESYTVFSYYSEQTKQINKNSLYNQIRTLIEEQFKKLNETEYLEKCQNNLKQIDDNQIQLSPDEFEEQQTSPEHITPHLNIICEDHKKEIIFFDLNAKKSKENRIVCIDCLSGHMGLYTSISDAKSLWDDYQSIESSLLQEKEKRQSKRIEKHHHQFNSLLKKFDAKIAQINEYLLELNKNINNIVQEKMQIMGKDWNELSKVDILEIADILSKPQPKEALKSLVETQNTIEDQKLDSYIQDSIFFLKEAAEKCFRNFCSPGNQISEGEQTESECNTDCDELIADSSEIQENPYTKPPVYELLIQETKHTDKNTCYAIAINLQKTTLVAAFHKLIKVFGFQNGQIKLKQTLNDHDNCINTLVFMKKLDNFISGSDDKKIKIWALNTKNLKWFCQQTLIDHINLVNQIIVNREEDLLISCSDDMTIKFWSFEETWKCSQGVKDHVGPVLNICLNESQNKLVSCGLDHQILIYQLEHKIWSLKQKIKGYGYRIGFISDFLIAFQPVNSKKMKIYKLNKEENIFEKFKRFKLPKGERCRYSFPMIFNQEKKLLINKNGRLIHIIRIINEYVFQIEQTLEFKVKNGYIFGAASDDGEFLATWDNFSKEVQIRKYKQL